MKRSDEERKERPLKPEELKPRLLLVQDTVKKIEAEVAQGTIPSEGMEDFKRAIDEARMRIWAVLMAANDSDPAGYLERFRMRRAIEICRGIHRDIGERTLSPDHPEAAELLQVTRALGNALEDR
ncbi:MAG TPA: hypothetical protein VFT04_05295 [Gemmatimonadales bacterium]|nr:hypothetical protein [Gemmatimonadales bacterium]